jgi:membrane protein YdbS with pleckstrin-like domain
MDYQITCICGHSFLISDPQIEQPVACPACQRRLNPVVVAPKATAGAAAPPPPAAPGAATASPAAAAPSAVPANAAEATKRCPFCGEVILAVARKCKHCGEFLDRAAPDGAATLTGAASTAAPASGQASASDPTYTLSVSQWDNFWKFVILLAVVLAISAVVILITSLRTYAAVVIPAALVFAGFFGWFYYLAAKNTRVTVRPFRIDTETGILSKKMDTLELFRISDVQLQQGLVERLLGIGTIKLMTADSTDEPELVLYQIPKAREVYRYLQTQIPIAAKQRGAVYMEK